MLKEFITCRFCKEVHKRDYYPSSGSLFVNGVDVKARKNVCKSCMKEYKHKKYKKAGKVKCSCDELVLKYYMPEHLKTAKHTRLLNSERCFKCKKMVLREKMTRYNDAYICPCINKKKKKAGRPKGSKNKKKKPVDVKLDVEEPAKVLHGASK